RHGLLPRALLPQIEINSNDILALEASEPMPLPTIIPLNVVCGCFTLHQLVWRDDRRIGSPLVRAVHFDVPFGQAIDHLLQRRLVPSPTFPVEQLPRVTIERFPDPEFTPLFLQRPDTKLITV